MISTSDFSRGLVILIDGQLFSIVDFSASHMGRGGALMKTKLKSVEQGNVIERVFKSGEKFERAILDNRPMQYLYKQENLYTFMDTESYEQMTLGEDDLGEAVNYLKENDMITVNTYKGRAISIDLPPSVDLKVIDAPPGVRGNTVSGATKPAIVETGLSVQVPLFVNPGEVIKVDTRTGAYITRV